MRRIFFWLHLTAGVCAGTLIFTMCVTGTLLTYERQINAWADRRNIPLPAAKPGTARLAPEELLTKVRQASGMNPTGLGLYAAPGEPAEVSLGPEGTLLANPYTGEILGRAATGTRDFFRVVKELHRWLGMGGTGRNTGKALMDAGNLIFFFIILSGLYLWFPRKLTWQRMRPVVLFRANLKGKARDFNWHNVIGVWAWVPLFLIAGSGVVMSYPWATNLLYSATGSRLPGAGAAKGGEAGGRSGARPPNYDGLNQAWRTAEAYTTGWAAIRVQFPINGNTPFNFNIDKGDGGQPQARGTLLVQRTTGDVVSWTPFSAGSLGLRARTLLRFTHTGESLGMVGQTIAGLATAGGGVMVCTGIALSLRRLAAWRRRRRAVTEAPSRDHKQPVSV